MNITRIKTSIAPSSSAGQCSSFWWYFHQIFCLMSLYLVNFQIKIYNWTGPDWCIFSRGSDFRIILFVHLSTTEKFYDKLISLTSCIFSIHCQFKYRFLESMLCDSLASNLTIQSLIFMSLSKTTTDSGTRFHIFSPPSD